MNSVLDQAFRRFDIQSWSIMILKAYFFDLSLSIHVIVSKSADNVVAIYIEIKKS
jgi:hypothetical protein